MGNDDQIALHSDCTMSNVLLEVASLSVLLQKHPTPRPLSSGKVILNLSSLIQLHLHMDPSTPMITKNANKFKAVYMVSMGSLNKFNYTTEKNHKQTQVEAQSHHM
jgi:alkylated DNA repair dioxygenase AlkB